MDDNRLSWNNAYPTTIEGAREGTASLLSKVLGITALGFLITSLGVYTAPDWSTLPGIIAVFGLVLAINFTRKANPALALGMFLALAYFMGWEIGPLIHRYVRTIGPTVVFQAAATTGLGMAAMGCVAYLFQINYRKIAGFALAALLVLILLGVVEYLLPLHVAGYLFVADAGDLYAADGGGFCTDSGGWRWEFGGDSGAVDLSGCD